ENVKGIEESSEKAIRIMEFTTILVILMIGWCGYTLWVRGGHLPPLPVPSNLHFSIEAEGWLYSSHLPEIIGIIGILVAFGHSVLAMSGLETLAQVYREIEHPKLPNLKKTAFIVFIFSMVFTSLVSFFAFMIIPNAATRLSYKDNLIGGLAMNVVGPVMLRLLFHGFVVIVGIMILSGAVNTAIVGSNGVLNRVSEDGVLADWFRQPHPRFGTSHRIINLVVALQLLTIFLSRGNVILLGEAYAFGVIWSFAMKGLGVLVLRFTRPGPREFRVPANPRLGRLEFPVGLAFITVTLFATATINLFTKQVATVTGVTFTLLFYALFVISEKHSQRRAARGELDQFNLEPSEEITPEGVGSRPGNILVPVPDYFKLYHLASVLERVDIERQDVVVLHIRVLLRAGSGEHGLEPEQLFTVYEQELFTRALALSEKYGKSVKLAVVGATDVWDGILRAAQNLQSSSIVLGSSTKMSPAVEARRAGLAWENLRDPKPQLTVEVYSPRGQEEVYYLGPHAPHLTPNEIDLLHKIWLECSARLEPEEIHHHDIIHFALTEIDRKLCEGEDREVLERLKHHLEEMKSRRVPHL
ncbi:MAG: APC family permease, partial [Acidobacteriota bacterium]